MDFIPARALIVLGTVATQYAHVTRFRDPNAETLDRISRALSFIDLRKPAKIALRSSPSDAFTLIASKAIFSHALP